MHIIKVTKMPKRTNDFQELIATIYKQITPEAAKVTESAMVFDKEAKVLREVDILVEYRYAHHDFKLVIECRDRSRKDSVQWVDELIGKSRSLGVDKIVAVSKEGFTQAAQEKAGAYGIETLTVEEAIEKDWGKYPIKPGVVVLSAEKFWLHDVLFKEESQFRSLRDLGLNSVVVKEGVEIGSVRDVFQSFFQQFLLPRIEKKVREEFREIFKTTGDLSKPLYIESDNRLSGFRVRLFNGSEVDISDVKFLIYGIRLVANVETSHIKFNEMMISAGKHIESDGSVLKFSVIQDPEEHKIHVRWERED